MGKGKLAKFADLDSYENVMQYPYAVLQKEKFPLRGRWHEEFFGNHNPIVLELGCGKGEYTVGLARMFPDVNFIGVDIKGARLWSGATQARQEELRNVAFLRTSIELIEEFFTEGEVEELWLTFSDPQMKNPRKRLTSTWFLERYRKLLTDGGIIHLKTDSRFLFTYTSYVVQKNALPLLLSTDDLYADTNIDAATRSILGIRTYYEGMWMERGLSIKYIKFRLPREGVLAEPDIEIPVDDYRSYKREQRMGKEKAL